MEILQNFVAFSEYMNFMDQSKDEPKPNENLWSDVADLMRNDKSITKITGKRMRKTMTKFYKWINSTIFSFNTSYKIYFVILENS